MPDSETECLHCEINEVIEQYVERHNPINLAELVAKTGESLIELIMLGPEDDWGNLLAEAIRHMGYVYLEKTGAVQGDTTH